MFNIKQTMVPLGANAIGLAAIFGPYILSPWHGIIHGYELLFPWIEMAVLILANIALAFYLTASREWKRMGIMFWLAVPCLAVACFPMCQLATDLKDGLHPW